MATKTTQDQETRATFAAGCFWCVQHAFDGVKGVKSVMSGYTGGHVDAPDYGQVSAGGTGHYEAVQIVFDPKIITYEELLDIFWRNVDPLDAGGQFCDRGSQYRGAIFTHSEAQKKKAQDSLDALNRSGRFDQPVQTQIHDAQAFYPAEDYHQKYYDKNPFRYKTYRYLCGRDKRLRELWGAPKK